MVLQPKKRQLWYRFRPQIYLEEPRRLPVPIVIRHYKHKKPVTVNRTTESTKAFRKRDKNVISDIQPSGSLIGRWKERRALKNERIELEKEQNRILQEQIAIARREKDDIVKHLQKQEEYLQEIKRNQEEKCVPPPIPPYKPVQKSIFKTSRTKKVRQAKTTTAKPKAQSKCVNVNKHLDRRPFCERFVTCFYRTCCQLFCCFSVILVACIAVILLV